MTVGSAARYSCDEGYVLVGDPARVCESDGTWSGEPPRCQIGRKSTVLCCGCISHLCPPFLPSQRGALWNWLRLLWRETQLLIPSAASALESLATPVNWTVQLFQTVR